MKTLILIYHSYTYVEFTWQGVYINMSVYVIIHVDMYIYDTTRFVEYNPSNESICMYRECTYIVCIHTYIQLYMLL